MLSLIEHWISRAAGLFNGLAAAAVLAMMGLTCADVIMRLFRRPIPGTYELVGLLGACFAAFALGYTSLKRGHIAVDFLVDRLPPKAQAVVDAVNALVCSSMFAWIAWALWRYGNDLKSYGQVSMTVQVPIYPFVYGIGMGCALLALVLMVRFARCVVLIAGGQAQAGASTD